MVTILSALRDAVECIGPGWSKSSSPRHISSKTFTVPALQERMVTQSQHQKVLLRHKDWGVLQPFAHNRCAFFCRKPHPNLAGSLGARTILLRETNGFPSWLGSRKKRCPTIDSKSPTGVTNVLPLVSLKIRIPKDTHIS